MNNPKTAKYISNDSFNELKAKEVFPGDILICRLAAPVGRAIQMPNINHRLVTSVDIAILRLNNKFYDKFVVSFLNTPRTLKKMEVFSTGSTRKRISRKNLEKIKGFIPGFDEQVKIGDTIEKLNNLITLNQERSKIFKKLKQFMLNNLTTQKEKRYPKLRFIDFNENWKIEKLNSMAPIRGGYAFKSNHYKEKGIPIIRIANILDNGTIGGEFVYYNKSQYEENITLCDGDIVIAMSGATTGKVAKLSSLPEEYYYQNQRVGLFTKNNKFDYNFIYTLVLSNEFTRQLALLLVSGTQPNISSKDLNTFKFKIPVEIEEQEKIGNTINDIEKLLIQTNMKIALLESLKKQLLNDLFV